MLLTNLAACGALDGAITLPECQHTARRAHLRQGKATPGEAHLTRTPRAPTTGAPTLRTELGSALVFTHLERDGELAGCHLLSRASPRAPLPS